MKLFAECRFFFAKNSLLDVWQSQKAFSPKMDFDLGHLSNYWKLSDPILHNKHTRLFCNLDIYFERQILFISIIVYTANLTCLILLFTAIMPSAFDILSGAQLICIRLAFVPVRLKKKWRIKLNKNLED